MPVSPRLFRWRTRPWLGLSVLVHLAVFAVLWLVFVDPPRTIEERRQEQLQKLSSQKLEEAADRLREINEEQIARNVEQLEEILAELKEIEHEQIEALAEELADRPAEALAAALALIDQVLAAQLRLIEAQQANRQELAELGEALTAMVNAEPGQDRFRSFADGPGYDAMRAYVRRISLLNAANTAIEEIQILQSRLAEELAWLKAPELMLLQDGAVQAQEKAKNQNNATGKRIEWSKRDLRDLKGKTTQALRVKANDRVLAYATEAADRVIDRQAWHVANVNRLQPEAIEGQRIAYEAQLEVKDALLQTPPPPALTAADLIADAGEPDSGEGEDATESGDETEPTTPQTADATMSVTADEAATDDTAPGDDATAEATEAGESGESGDSGGGGKPSLSQLYHSGVKAEQAMAKVHGNIKAGALIKASGVSPGSAKAMVSTPAPNRPTVDAATLDGPVYTGEAYERYEKELATAVNTTTQMVRSAEARLAAARTAAEGETALALADGLTVTPDTEGQSGETGESGSAGAEEEESQSEGEATEGEDELTGTGGPGGDDNPGDGEPAQFDAEARRRALMAAVEPGRKIAAVGGDQPWTFIDGWYTIGPFRTGTSAGLNEPYPPESVVDLDAHYTGPDGRELAWSYRKETNRGTFYFPDQASNAVNFAFTYLRADRDMAVWLAVGSDDGMRLWLNDLPVEGPGWHGNEHPWQFSFGHDIPGYNCHLHFRAYRQVRLQQGLNRVLVRVDNGPGGTGFAMYLTPATAHTTEAPPMAEAAEKSP